MLRIAAAAFAIAAGAAAASAEPAPPAPPAEPVRIVPDLAKPPPADRPVETDREAVRAKLQNLRVSLEFSETSLEDAIDFIRQFSRLNIIIDKTVQDKFGAGEPKITLKAKDLPLASAFRLMLETRGMTLLFRHGVLLVVTEERASQNVVLRLYDVRDLLMKINDFPGPEITLVPLGGVGIQNLPEPTSQLTDEFVLSSVRQHCGQGTWDANPKVSVEYNNGILIVRQTEDVHKQIRVLLDKLRANK
jgi:type II secretory pathway component GspD/PulD (secretin)